MCPKNVQVISITLYNINVNTYYNIYLLEKSSYNYVRGEKMDKKLQISRRSGIKGEDGYKTFSVRIKDSTVEVLEKIAAETNRSRNEIINMMLEFGLENFEIIRE